LALLILLRLFAPLAVKKGINYAISTTPGISGSVGDVDIALYRGAYQVNDIALYIEDGQQQKPLIKVSQLDISVLWSALLNGAVVAELAFTHPAFYYLDTAGQDTNVNPKVKDEKTWITLVKRLAPFSIDRVDIIDGVIALATFSDERKTITEIQEVNGQITNLTNSRSFSGSLVTQMAVQGKIAGVCPLAMSGSYDPYARNPTFDFDVEMQRLPVKQIDHLISFYTPFDFEAGEVDFAMELAARQGQVQGYVEVGIYHLDVFDWQEDVVKDGDNPFEWLFEGLAGGMSEILENDKKDLLATRVPLEGKIDNIDTPLLPAIGAILKNGFIKAFDMKVDKVISFDESS
jgi:hypothetical protein